jgi:hypothetical protein
MNNNYLSIDNIRLQISAIVSLVLFSIYLSCRLIIGACLFIFIIGKAINALHLKSQRSASLDKATHFNLINYPDEIDCSFCHSSLN